MKKLLIASDSFLPRWDGIARFLKEIIPLLEDKYEIKVLAPDFSGKYEADTNVVRFPLSRIIIADYPVCRPSFKKIKSEEKDSDIVWVNTIGPIGVLAIIAAKSQKKKIAAYIHSIEWELYPKSLNAPNYIKWIVKKISYVTAKYFYNKCDILLVPSKGTADTLEKSGLKQKKIVVPLGTDTKTFTPPESKGAAKTKLGINADQLVVGYAGRVGNEKDLQTLYRAFGRINRKHNAVLLIAGQDLGGVTKKFKNNPKTRIFGTTGEIVQFLQAMDIYVLPSLTETTSLSTMEAMSCGLPVITTNVGSIKEYVKDNFNGIIFENGNAYQLAKKLDYLLSNEHIRKTIGQNARRTIINRFTWEATASKIKDAFDKL